MFSEPRATQYKRKRELRKCEFDIAKILLFSSPFASASILPYSCDRTFYYRLYHMWNFILMRFNSINYGFHLTSQLLLHYLIM